jgi:hypothetical protein
VLRLVGGADVFSYRADEIDALRADKVVGVGVQAGSSHTPASEPADA